MANATSIQFGNGLGVTDLGSGVIRVDAGAAPGSVELDYSQVTIDSAVISATTEAAAVTLITSNPITYDGSTKVRVEFFAPGTVPTAELGLTLVWLRDSTVIGQTRYGNKARIASGIGVSMNSAIFDTPPAGSHTYSVKAFVDTSSVIVKAGSGGAGAFFPAFIRVTRDSAVGPTGAQGPPGTPGTPAIIVASSVAGLGAAVDGAMGRIRVPNLGTATGYDTMDLIYDATMGKWVSADWVAWTLMNDTAGSATLRNLFNPVSSSAWTVFNPVFVYGPFYDAGLRLQARTFFRMSTVNPGGSPNLKGCSAGSNGTASPTVDTTNTYGAAGATQNSNGEDTSRDSGWVDFPAAIVKHDRKMLFCQDGVGSGNGTSRAGSTIRARWVA